MTATASGAAATGAVVMTGATGAATTMRPGNGMPKEKPKHIPACAEKVAAPTKTAIRINLIFISFRIQTYFNEVAA